MVRGSWFVVRGVWSVVRGSWCVVREVAVLQFGWRGRSPLRSLPLPLRVSSGALVVVDDSTQMLITICDAA